MIHLVAQHSVTVFDRPSGGRSLFSIEQLPEVVLSTLLVSCKAQAKHGWIR